MDTTDVFLDRSWPNLGLKIDPVSNEFTDFEISSFLWSKILFFWLACFSAIPAASVLLLELERLYESCVIRIRELSAFLALSSRQGRQNWTSLMELTFFFENFGVMKNRSSRVTFSKTHRWTQRMYSWTGRDLMKVRKLVPCQTNSRILKYITFSVRKSHIFYSLSKSRFPSRPYYS